MSLPNGFPHSNGELIFFSVSCFFFVFSCFFQSTLTLKLYNCNSNLSEILLLLSLVILLFLSAADIVLASIGLLSCWLFVSPICSCIFVLLEEKLCSFFVFFFQDKYF